MSIYLLWFANKYRHSLPNECPSDFKILKYRSSPLISLWCIKTESRVVIDSLTEVIKEKAPDTKTTKLRTSEA